MNQLQFDDRRNYDDWGTYLSKYEIGDAEPKEYYVDIPSGHGSLDLTEAITGEVSYGDRKFHAELTLAPPRDEWMHKVNKIRNYLNGRTRKLLDPLDSEYYFIGRFKTQFNTDGALGIMTITGVLQPYKYKVNRTVLNFVIPETGKVSGILPNASKRVIPEITTDDAVNLTYRNKSIALKAGAHKITNVVLESGSNSIVITGPKGATVTFVYQEGAL